MIKNGQEANETNFNAAFLSRTADSTTTGKIGLGNTSDANSGGAIANAQRAITETFDAVGITGEGDTARKQYSSNNYIANGDSHKVALGKLDTQAKAQSQAPANVSTATGTLPLANGGTGQTSKASAYDALSPNTTEGDLEVRGPASTSRLGVGANGQVLTVDTTQSGKLKWATPSAGSSDLSQATGVLPISKGGTGQTTKASAFNALSPITTTGDLITSDGTNNTRLGVGSNGQYLTVVNSQPQWATVAPGSVAQFYHASYYFSASTTAVTANQTIKFPTKYKDDNTLYNPTTGLLTVVAADLYSLSVTVSASFTAAWWVKINGTNTFALMRTLADSGPIASSPAPLILPANATVGIYADNGGNVYGSNATYGFLSYFSLTRLGR